MIPSCEAVAENIKRHVTAMAVEIGKRTPLAEPEQKIIESIARQVLLDWFLGDWLPGQEPRK